MDSVIVLLIWRTMVSMNAAFLSLFLVESLLTWSAGDADRDALFAVFEPILKNSVSEHNHSESNKGV